ncbi:MAG: universal stress protein [Candidatus Obscuribacterales bacterium]|nr:universal stress protein [Candidatus Obscuribacterales bacterium]
MKKILVALDGSECSQFAVDYSIWLASNLEASLTGLHVIDPRLADLFIAPEFAEALGFAVDSETVNKVTNALKEIGSRVLELFRMQVGTEATVNTLLTQGLLVPEIVNRASLHDLVIIGHHGQKSLIPIADSVLGSVAERVAIQARVPVLICENSISNAREIVVAYDGSEPSRGALLFGQALSSATGKKLRAVTVAMSDAHRNEALLTVEQGRDLLRLPDTQEVFCVLNGPTTETILEYVEPRNALLIVGAYGFRTPEENVLGSTTTSLIRRANTSILLFR